MSSRLFKVRRSQRKLPRLCSRLARSSGLQQRQQQRASRPAATAAARRAQRTASANQKPASRRPATWPGERVCVAKILSSRRRKLTSRATRRRRSSLASAPSGLRSAAEESLRGLAANFWPASRPLAAPALDEKSLSALAALDSRARRNGRVRPPADHPSATHAYIMHLQRPAQQIEICRSLARSRYSCRPPIIILIIVFGGFVSTRPRRVIVVIVIIVISVVVVGAHLDGWPALLN